MLPYEVPFWGQLPIIWVIIREDRSKSFAQKGVPEKENNIVVKSIEVHSSLRSESKTTCAAKSVSLQKRHDNTSNHLDDTAPIAVHTLIL